jgi:hypothetical protein
MSRKYSQSNLNGPVKAIYTTFTYKKEDVNRWHAYKSSNDLPKGGNFEFYENGLKKTSSLHTYRNDSLNYYRPIDVKKSYNFEYNVDDVEKLFSLKINLKYYQNVYTDLLYYQPSYYAYSYPSDGDLEKQLSEYVYIYSYDDKGRIKEQRYYNPWHMNDFTPYKTAKEEDLYYTITFHYNNKNQVIKQIFTDGTQDFGDDYKQVFILFEHTILSNEVKKEVHYKYDEQGRITQVSLYDFNEEKPLIGRADYTYHPTKDYVEKVENFYEYGLSIMDFPTKRWISNYNEQGDIIKREFVMDSPDQSTFDTATRFYDYEYDQYNNWIKCYLYLEGKKVKGDPTLIAERKIEYYE